jgi:hypothetical protein
LGFKTLFLVAAIEVGLRVLGVTSSPPVFAFSLLASALILESRRDFDSVASELGKKGVRAQAPAVLMGKSGVKHEFAFAVLEEEGKARVVVDTELSVREVDEMKVLKFYVKVFDISPAKAILCVCPGLGQRAKSLAKEYGITVLEDEVPRNLIPKASEAVEKMLQGDRR